MNIILPLAPTQTSLWFAEMMVATSACLQLINPLCMIDYSQVREKSSDFEFQKLRSNIYFQGFDSSKFVSVIEIEQSDITQEMMNCLSVFRRDALQRMIAVGECIYGILEGAHRVEAVCQILQHQQNTAGSVHLFTTIPAKVITDVEVRSRPATEINAAATVSTSNANSSPDWWQSSRLPFVGIAFQLNLTSTACMSMSAWDKICGYRRIKLCCDAHERTRDIMEHGFKNDNSRAMFVYNIMKGRPPFKYLESTRRNVQTSSDIPDTVSFKGFAYSLTSTISWEALNSEMKEAGDVDYKTLASEINLAAQVVANQWLMDVLTNVNTRRSYQVFDNEYVIKNDRLLKHRLFNVNGISTILRCLTIKAPTCSDHIVEDSIFAEEVARCVLFRFLEYMQTDQDENLVDSTYFKMTAIMAHISVLQVHLALQKLSCKKVDDIFLGINFKPDCLPVESLKILKTTLSLLLSSCAYDADFDTRPTTESQRNNIFFYDGELMVKDLKKGTWLKFVLRSL